MNANMKARLDRIGQRLGSDGRPVIVFQQVGETREDAMAKIERWKAGEAVEDVRAQFPYTGGEPLIIRILKFCPSPKAAANLSHHADRSRPKRRWLRNQLVTAPPAL